MESSAQDQSSFLLEAWESLAAIEHALALWLEGSVERGRGELEVVCHRLHGSAALYGWQKLAALAERLEGLVRRHPPEPLDPVTPFVEIFSEATSIMPTVLDSIATAGSDSLPALDRLTSRLDLELVDEDRIPAPDVDEELRRFRREQPLLVEPFSFEAEELWDGCAEALARLDASPQDLRAVDHLFRRTHTLKGAALMVGCRPIGDLSHRAEELLAGYQRRRRSLPREAVTALGKASLALRAMLDLLAGAEASAAAVCREASEALAAAPDCDAALAEGPPPETAKDGVPAAAPENRLHEPARGKLIRVDRARLDVLLDLMGDLLAGRDAVERKVETLGTICEHLEASRRRMEETVSRFSERYLDPTVAGPPAETAPPTHGFEEFGELELDRYDDFNILARHVAEVSDDVSTVHRDLRTVAEDLREGSARLQKLIRQARSEIGRTRLAPVDPLFARLGRLVAEVAEEEGKVVEIALVGGDVQADGALMDRLGEPLMHLLQNAVIHGIERPASRLEAGKPPTGKIALRAAAHGSSLRIEVEDDGAGIDLEKLRDVALKERFASREQVEALGDRGAAELVFLPGLSTVDQVSRRAGRGVGMDAVREAVARLDGDVEVSTEAGEGTRFVLTMPATLLLSEALLVGVGEEGYALALPAVKKIVAFAAGELPEPGDAVTADELAYDFRYLSQVLGRPKEIASPTETPVVLIGAGGRRLALAVDRVEGIAEITVRPFDPLLAGVPLFAGGISMPDGRLVLVLDNATLFAFPELGEASPHQPADGASPAVERGDGSKRILVADDSHSVRTVLRRTLERAGFSVTTAADGLEALEALRDRPFDAVVTDLEMPRLNGYELIGDLRRRFSPDRLPIVVITSRASHKHAEHARALGASAYVYKPIDNERLVALLNEGTGRASGSPAARPGSGTPGAEHPA